MFNQPTLVTQWYSKDFLQEFEFESRHKSTQWMATAAEGRSGNNNRMSSIKCGWKWVRVTHTSAESVGPPEDPALLDLSERREHDPDVVLVALLRHHADEQLPVFHRCRAEEKKESETEWVEALLQLYYTEMLLYIKVFLVFLLCNIFSESWINLLFSYLFFKGMVRKSAYVLSFQELKIEPQLFRFSAWFFVLIKQTGYEYNCFQPLC